MSREHFSIRIGQEYNPCALPEGASIISSSTSEESNEWNKKRITIGLSSADNLKNVYYQVEYLKQVFFQYMQNGSFVY